MLKRGSPIKDTIIIIKESAAEEKTKAIIEDEIISTFRYDFELKNFNKAESMPNEKTGFKKANIV
jgi:hypothetical protein